MSNAMLEALGCGVPVLAINNSDVSTEGIVVDGVNGFLVTELSVPALARGLIRAINEIPQMDREQISRDAHQRFSRDEYLARYRSLLQEVIGE
jgi:glycosyltransferase involved in cell wall biosynthesis